jgi:hypothetical protein
MESQEMIEAYIAKTRAEIDAWAIKSMPKKLKWETNKSIWDATVWMERNEYGVNFMANGDILNIAPDTTLPELLTVCRVLGIPIDVEGAM